MQSTGGGANYVGSAHWAAVLDGIAELKDHLDNEESHHSDSQGPDLPCPQVTGPQLLYGCPKPADKDEIFSSIPARSVVDRLVSRYFNSFEMSPAVLHSVQFLKEYEGFWENPQATSPIWLGLLFTIMCLATQFEKSRLDPGVQSPAVLSMERELQEMVDTFRLRIPQCLVLGSYAKGGPFVLETLMLYIAAEIFLSSDAEIEIWILMGNTVQLALHMGYHRDPKHFKGLSPFAAEMRRRIWATIVEMDLGLSAQMGLPRMIKHWQTDTQEPSNLQDSDFDSATVEMPPSRLNTDLTPILYRLVKARLMTTIGYIWDFSADLRSYPYTEVQKMDDKLDQARKSIPECLRWHSMARNITDSPQQIMQKVILETIFYRAKIVLHRKYMFLPLAQSASSRRIVLESALKLLDYQHMLQEETQPFCQLYQERWRVSSLVNHDFLLATSILCYYLQHARGVTPQLSESTSFDETIMVSLKRSHDIWLQSSNSSKEARKVVRALAVVLGRVNTPSADSGGESSLVFGLPSTYPSSTTNDYSQETPGGLGSQFPMFNSALMPNWETFADDLISAPMITPTAEWQEMDALHQAIQTLSSGEGVKIILLQLSDQVHFLLAGMHHIYLDGYSFSVFFKDLESAHIDHRLPPLPVESQYRSFALQQRKMYEDGDVLKSIEYYRRTFPKEFTPIELLPFATTASRQVANEYSQHEAKLNIPPDISAKVRRVARANRSTSFHVYLAALKILLFSLLPDTDEVFIGIADANRGDKNFMGSLGFFLNLLPLRFRRGKPGSRVSSTIQTTRDAVYGALQHSQLPFDVLLRELNVPRSDKYTPIFHVFMDYRQVVQERSSWGGCKLGGEKWCNAGTGYDVALEVTENINTDTLLSLRLQRQLYSEDHTHVLLRSYLGVLEYMVRGSDKAVDVAPTWSSYDLQASIDAGKAPEFEPKWQSTISHQIDQVIQNNTEKSALKDGNGNVLTYEQMGTRINTISKALIDAGTVQGTVVGVFQEPSADWICSLLAIFKAGAVYVPLDLRNSIPRLVSIVKASRPSVIITDGTTDDKVELIGAKFVTKLQLASLDESTRRDSTSINHAKVGSLAVILFTSGSTGEPKGLMMTHTNLASYAEVSSKTFARADEDLVVLQQSPFSFDFSLDQTMAALTNGGCLYVVPTSKRGDPDEISKIMVEDTETIRQCTSWKYAFSGGEAMSYKLAREFGSLKLTNLHVFNGYGPAETTILSHRIDLKYADPDLPDPLPAGYPWPGFSVCIVDDKMRPLPLGVQGEIVLGGPCTVVAIGAGYPLTGYYSAMAVWKETQ
ncbi:hypothetical protein ACHAPD_005807 [Fusarium lateritium]